MFRCFSKGPPRDFRELSAAFVVPFTNEKVGSAKAKRASTYGALRLPAVEWRCGVGRRLRLRATRGRCGAAGKRRPKRRQHRCRKWRLVRARMAVAAAAAATAMSAAGGGGASAARSISRFRGCLAGALLGDCVGAVYEAHDTVSLASVLSHVESLEPDPGTPGSARTGGRGTTDRVPTPGRGDRDSGARAQTRLPGWRLLRRAPTKSRG